MGDEQRAGQGDGGERAGHRRQAEPAGTGRAGRGGGAAVPDLGRGAWGGARGDRAGDGRPAPHRPGWVAPEAESASGDVTRLLRPAGQVEAAGIADEPKDSSAFRASNGRIRKLAAKPPGTERICELIRSCWTMPGSRGGRRIRSGRRPSPRCWSKVCRRWRLAGHTASFDSSVQAFTRPFGRQRAGSFHSWVRGHWVPVRRRLGRDVRICYSTIGAVPSSTSGDLSSGKLLR